MPIRRLRRISQQQAGYLSHCHPKVVGFENPRIRPAKLALEVPEAELDWVKEKLPQMMAKVDAGILKAPLVAEAGVGANWEDVH